eukprot:TRINITY_DN65791_c0_g1_i1.p1 TRINITY_DN65791_c0_g1~~TRINITY_DN65791_c0_g1_i1.p1  ORF type:complete len:674 (-),score=152.73 TRINITY_DN65791_c0_g1_i1:89-2110(-)
MRHGRGGGSSLELPEDEDLEEAREAGLLRILKLARGEFFWILVGLLLLFMGLVPLLAMPIYFGKVIDDIGSTVKTPAEKRTAVYGHLMELVALLFVGTASTIGRAFIFNGAGERVVARLRLALFKAIMQQEIAMFDRRKTGELLSRLTADTTSLQDVATSNVSMFVRGIAQMAFSGALMFYTSWQLATVILCVVPPLVLVVAVYGRVVKRLSTKYSDALGHASDVAQQSVANVRTVRSFAAEDLEVEKYAKAVGDPDDPQMRQCCWYPRGPSSYYAGIQKTIAGAFFQAFVTLVGLGAITAVIWFGAFQVIDGHLSQGSLITFILYSVQIAGSFGMMAGLLASLFSAKGASRRTFQLIDRVPRVPTCGGETRPRMQGVIEFQKVNFEYPSRKDVPVLRDFSLLIPENETVAFVGSSGAGKSTILALIQRFYDVSSGRILIDGLPLETLDPSWVRRNFAYVQQEPTLFGATIAQNIAYGYAVREGNPDAVPSREALENVAKLSNAHDFITSFPEGYDTVVGERGVRLSGGQKQRIAIARALMMDPRVLLLDEATSALDAENEAIVARAVEKAMVGRTTLIVAHRLSTVKSAKTIVVVEKGSIAATGSHEELLVKSEKYKELVQGQLVQGQPSESASPSTTNSTVSANGHHDGSSPAPPGPPEGGRASLAQRLLR